MATLKMATVWLAGCSGCHMSFLDLDEWLFDLAEQVELVYSPLADLKQFPDCVDITLVEGAVANNENLYMAKVLRKQSKWVISFGDCAVTGNVTALRNPFGLPQEILLPVYGSAERNAHPGDPNIHDIVPGLLNRVVPLHAVIPVDDYLPGCPPSAGAIKHAIQTWIARQPHLPAHPPSVSGESEAICGVS